MDTTRRIDIIESDSVEDVIQRLKDLYGLSNSPGFDGISNSNRTASLIEHRTAPPVLLLPDGKRFEAISTGNVGVSFNHALHGAKQDNMGAGPGHGVTNKAEGIGTIQSNKSLCVIL